MLVRFGALAVLGCDGCQSLHFLLRTEKTAVFGVKFEILFASNWVNISPKYDRHQTAVVATLQLT